MEKFPSQQAALRAAFLMVLGQEPKKGELVISDEQRQKVGELMMGWLQQDRWSIRPGTRAASSPLNYVIGKQPTCLIEAWVTPRPTKQNTTGSSPESKMAALKLAVESGLITKEQAQEQALKLLGM